MSAASATPDNFALIIGAMKSGTTSLFEILTQHPEVAGARIKEPDFFSEPAVFERGWDWYRGLWDWRGGHTVALEASVSYTKAPIWAGVPQRIAAMPDARFRFIYMIRHPFTRISSQVRHSLYEGWGKSLDEDLTEDLIDFSRHAMQADRYMEVFPRSALLIKTLEEFSASPTQVLEEICRFLEIDPSFPFASVERRYNKGDLYGLPSSLARVVRGGALRAVADRLLPRSVRHRIRDALTGAARADNPTLGRYELNEMEQQRVLERLEQDHLRLRDHYGVDVERHWGLTLPRSAG
jgi:hypothetical protein